MKQIIIVTILFLLLASIHGCKRQTSQEDSESIAKKEIDYDGFELIFDGKTLNNWNGDPTYWKVENGTFVGEVTPETLLEPNAFNCKEESNAPFH